MFVLTMLGAATSFGWATEPNSEQAKAIAAVEKLGGKANIEESSRGEQKVTVDFRGTSVEDTGLSHLRQWPAIDNLYLDGTRITDAGLEHLAGLRQWRELSLSDTKITGERLASLNGLPCLNCLVLNGTQVTDAGLKSLRGLPQLTWLDLSKTKVSDDGLQHLKQFPKLRVLDLTGNNITDAGLGSLGSLTEMRELTLANTHVTDIGLQKLKGFKLLEVLSLEGTEITDAGLEHITSLGKLQYLYLGNTKVTADRVEDLQQAMPVCHVELRPSESQLPATTKPDGLSPEDSNSAVSSETDRALECGALVKMLLTDGNPLKRRCAAFAIAQLQWNIPKEALESLATAVQHDKEKVVRAAALDAILVRDGAAEMPWSLLIGALHDSSPSVRVRAAVAIDKKLGGHAEDESQDWRNQDLLVKAGQDKDPVVRALVSLAVGKKSTERMAALPVLLSALRQEDASPIPAIQYRSDFEDMVLEYIADIGPEAKSAVPLLLERLGKMQSLGNGDDRADEAARRARATASVLICIGQGAVPELAVQVVTKHGTARTVAAMALAELGRERHLAIPALIRSLHRECGGRCVFTHTQRFDVIALARCGHEAVPALLEASKSQEIGVLACEALSLMTDDADAVTPQLIKALSHEDASIRSTAADVLENFSEKDTNVVPALVRATEDHDDGVARSASESLASIYVSKVQRDEDLKMLAGLDKLEHLTLSFTKIRGPGLALLSRLRNLRWLFLPSTVTDTGLEHLKAFPSLETISLTDAEITDAGLEHLMGLRHLRRLDLGHAKVTEAGVTRLRHALPNCKIEWSPPTKL